MNKKIALVDDHVLLRNGLANLLRSVDHEVLFEASNGKEMIKHFTVADTRPDVVLMDINMPEMDGYESTLWLRINFPEVKVLALSMYDDETSIIRMLKNGAKGYILKDCEPFELKAAIVDITTKGYYHSELVTGKLFNTINRLNESDDGIKTGTGLSAKETEFLRLSCTELTYKEIADKMCLSPRTIDGYRDALFEKLNLKSRVGLVIFAIKNGIVKV